MSHFPIFHTRAQPHHRILHEILIHFHVSNFSIGASVTDLGQNRRNVSFKFGVVRPPHRDISLFSIFFVKYNPIQFHNPTGFHFRGGEILVCQRREVKSQGAPWGGCTTPNLNDTLYTFQKILSSENFLEIFEIAQLLKRKVF